MQFYTKIFSLTVNLKNVPGTEEVLETINKLTDLEKKDTIRTQNEYFEEIASLTGMLNSLKLQAQEVLARAIYKWCNRKYFYRKKVYHSSCWIGERSSA